MPNVTIHDSKTSLPAPTQHPIPLPMEQFVGNTLEDMHTIVLAMHISATGDACNAHALAWSGLSGAPALHTIFSMVLVVHRKRKEETEELARKLALVNKQMRQQSRENRDTRGTYESLSEVVSTGCENDECEVCMHILPCALVCAKST